jgi:hypothetical protein
MRIQVAAVACGALVVAALGCGGSPAAPELPHPGAGPAAAAPTAEPHPGPPPPGPVLPVYPPETLVGAGDIAICGSAGAEATARLLDAIPGTVFTAGDNTYPSGTARSFRDCYDPAWGRHRARTRPTPGNHDYDVPGAGPYFDYFGANAGDGRGYYSYVLGTWLVLSINSNVAVDEGSPQYQWVASTLATAPSRCAVAIWHHPIVTSGPNGNHPHMQAMWRLLADANVEAVVSGHDHIYERYAPMDAGLGRVSEGTRLFIAGTGGAKPYDIVRVQPNSEVRSNAWGVLKLTLMNDRYDWAFVSVPGASFSDAGTDMCR